MPATPSAVGRRYSALVVLAVVQLMLVVLTPSKPPKTAASTALAAGPAAPTVEGPWSEQPVIDLLLTGSGVAAPGVLFSDGLFRMFVQTERMVGIRLSSRLSRFMKRSASNFGRRCSTSPTLLTSLRQGRRLGMRN